MSNVAPFIQNISLGLAHSVIDASDTPLLLLTADLMILAASRSFCDDFQIERPTDVSLESLGSGEWDVPQLTALLIATATGTVEVDDYEMTLHRPGKSPRTVLVNARRLETAVDTRVLVLLSVHDVTDERARDVQRDKLIREKAVLLQELQHRVANSLQIIASVLMQNARLVKSDEARSSIVDTHSRVMSIATMQQMLSITPDEEVDLRTYLTNLCRSVGASMIKDHDRLRINVDVDDSVVPASLSLNLGLVVTELVINSLKHGFPDDRGGRIEVRFRMTPDGWTLEVSDDGVGMAVSPKVSKAGLGSSIIRALAMQMDAEVVQLASERGTMVRLTFLKAQSTPDLPAL